MSHPRPTTRARVALVLAGTGGIVALTAVAASAHVSVTPSTTAAGSSAVLTFAVGHGCDGSSTTAITIRMPDGVVDVSPTVHPGWAAEKETETLAEPVEDGHGGSYTERVAQVVYTATDPLPEGYRATFELQLPLPGEAGDRVVFPVIQECEVGENAWVQTTAAGEDEPELPAPYVDLTAADDSGPRATGGAYGGVDLGGEGSESEVSSTASVGWTGVVLGALGLVAGSIALRRPRG